MNICHFETPIGILEICDTGDFITKIDLIKNTVCSENTNISRLGKECIKQLSEYFNKERTQFNLPLKFGGTEFQNKVWKALTKIPYGETRSYKDIAAAVGSPKAYRAVGMANHKNSVLIVAACHRVINSDGSLGGFGCGTAVKKQLLLLENPDIRLKNTAK